jgi:uncharacterized protein
VRIRFDAARSEPFLWKETIEVSPRELEGLALLGVSPIDCRGTVRFSDPDFVLHGGLAYEQTVACDRCLKPVRLAAGAELDLMLVERARPRSTSGETELSESDLGVVEVAGDSFDTRPLVMEQVALGVPMKPLCREDCRGLCPVCGIDRNEATCDCATARVDPRWAGLAALKDSLPDDRPGEG